jgi:hypothetical protein
MLKSFTRFQIEFQKEILSPTFSYRNVTFSGPMYESVTWLQNLKLTLGHDPGYGRQLLIAKTRFPSRVVHETFVLGKGALEQVFSQYFLILNKYLLNARHSFIYRQQIENVPIKACPFTPP